MIQVLIRPRFEADVDADEVERAVQAALKAESVSKDASLSVVITDDVEIRTLNRQFRQVDAPTDVLSFANDAPSSSFAVPPDEPPYLGDVILSFPRTRAQAAEQGHGVLQELRLLVVHGVLHLLGYDHDTSAQEARMWARQGAILDALRDADHG
jgi:probable rRNA maturation factor